MAVEHELQTLRELHRTVEGAAGDLERVADELDEALRIQLWTGPRAESLREAWRTRGPALRSELVEELRAAAIDIRVQHNNLASATGEADRL